MLEERPTLRHLAKIGYEAYIEDAGGLNYMGLPCPPWSGEGRLPFPQRRAWIAAVGAIIDELDLKPQTKSNE